MGDPIAEIKQEVGRIANKIARGTAQVAFQELQEAHLEIMNSFYSGYTPVKNYRFSYKDKETGEMKIGYAHGYKRTNNLRDGSLDPIGVIPSGEHSFKATIMVGANGMSDYVNGAGRGIPGSYVFDLMWNSSIRGFPPGYRGHVGEFSISASPAGLGISGSPDFAMESFTSQWIAVRGPEVSDSIAFSL